MTAWNNYELSVYSGSGHFANQEELDALVVEHMKRLASDMARLAHGYNWNVSLAGNITSSYDYLFSADERVTDE